jgi:hypothetical protein
MSGPQAAQTLRLLKPFCNPSGEQSDITDAMEMGATALELIEWMMEDGGHNIRKVQNEWYGGRNGIDAILAAKAKAAK